MALQGTFRQAVNLARALSVRMSSSVASPDPSSHSRNHGIDLSKFDPNNYRVPIRAATTDDLMEPYGSYKEAYAKEKSRGNKAIFFGVMSLMLSLFYFKESGVLEGLDMPNLYNIMEDTEPFNFDTEGRVSVTRDDDE